MLFSLVFLQPCNHTVSKWLKQFHDLGVNFIAISSGTRQLSFSSILYYVYEIWRDTDRKSPILSTPPVFGASDGVTLLEFHKVSKNYSWLFDGRLSVFTQYKRVTDRQTDGRTNGRSDTIEALSGTTSKSTYKQWSTISKQENKRYSSFRNDSKKHTSVYGRHVE